MIIDSFLELADDLAVDGTGGETTASDTIALGTLKDTYRAAIADDMGEDGGLEIVVSVGTTALAGTAGATLEIKLMGDSDSTVSNGTLLQTLYPATDIGTAGVAAGTQLYRGRFPADKITSAMTHIGIVCVQSAQTISAGSINCHIGGIAETPK